MLTKIFIKDVLEKEITEMTLDSSGRATHPFIGFSLVCQSMEVLGGCFDEYDWEDRNLSELRFRLAITKLFPEKYHQYNNRNIKIDLYKNLRCPMVHQMRPGKYMGLSERKHEETKNASNLHLTKRGDQLILVYEDFLKDFQEACEKIVNLIDSGELKTQKVLSHNISVPSDF